MKAFSKSFSTATARCTGLWIRAISRRCKDKLSGPPPVAARKARKKSGVRSGVRRGRHVLIHATAPDVKTALEPDFRSLDGKAAARAVSEGVSQGRGYC